MPRWPGFIGPSNTPQSVIEDAERTVNLYVESGQSQSAKSPSALYPTPGFQAWATVNKVGCRALKEADGRLFGVVGNGVYEFANNGVATLLGTVAVDANPAQIIYDGTVGGQLGIASGGSVYSFVLATNTFAGPHFGAATITMLAYAGGYGLGFDANTRRVYLSGFNDFTTWNSGTFFQRSQQPDPYRAMFVDQSGLVWMVGTETFEVRYNSGVGTQPFVPLSGLLGRPGIVAPFAFGVSRAGVFWVGRSEEGGASVVSSKGGAPVDISTYAVNTALRGYRRTSKITDAEFLIYHEDGHTFVNITFPSAPATWAFDAEARSWAERGQWKPADNRYDIWAPRVHADCFDKHLVGDRATGTIWDMSAAYATDVDGQGIRRLRRAPGITDEHKRIPIDQIELLMDVGVGTATGAGVDPQALLRISADGGQTFGNERRAGIGRMGQSRRRVTWTRLGAPEDCVPEIVWSDPVPIRVVGAFLNNAEKVA